jgi:hypothetical protein
MHQKFQHVKQIVEYKRRRSKQATHKISIILGLLLPSVQGLLQHKAMAGDNSSNIPARQCTKFHAPEQMC